MPPHGSSGPLTAGLATEKALVEDSAGELFRELGWETIDLNAEEPGPANPTGRQSFREAYLPARFRAALRRLNPDLPDAALANVEAIVTEDRSAMLPIAANRAVYQLLRDGITVEIERDGKREERRAVLVDWRDPSRNDFLLASQLKIASPLYDRRPDGVGFVNGVPLLLAEWKAPTHPVREAYDGNLSDYRDTVPHLFHANGFVILSNGLQALMGPSHAPFDLFAPWKKLEEEDTPDIGLERLLSGTCEPARFLDLIENFILFDDARGGLRKVVGKYHQVLGVNRAVERLEAREGNDKRLGVFWHTQGSGKSLSIAMFTEKVLRRLGGNWTFVIVTDRQELDDQITGTFANIGALRKDTDQAQAQSRAHLRELLAGQERYVFTLIHKFGTERGEAIPVLSDRSDIIVVTDEAHRSQYDQLAANMRQALPNASFIGFTGTPLIKEQEERTREVFGDYVSIYDFSQSVEDGATVPLYYEARKPELHLVGEDLSDELAAIVEEAELDEEAEKRLHRQFGQLYHLVTRDDRLDKVADDLARHFAARGYLGKGMFVAIDKATAVSMHNRVRAAWDRLTKEKAHDLQAAPAEARDALAERLAWMRAVDMAVVVSNSQGEVAELAAKGLDILPHRERMKSEDLEAKFKDGGDPLSLVFVCAMWITGFDVPTCSTVYIDKPMKNHTLMQTIARANRRAAGKSAGLIVDYIGVFQNLQKALAIYAAGGSGGDLPIRDKSALLLKLNEALGEAASFCTSIGIDPFAMLGCDKLERLKRIAEAVNVLVAPDERRRAFLDLAGRAARAYKAVLPDEAAAPYLWRVAALQVLGEAVRGRMGTPDLSANYARIEALLDERIEGVAIESPLIEGDAAQGRVDLSTVDFEKLAALFTTEPRTAAEKARKSAEERVKRMVEENPTRRDLAEKLAEMIAAYNANSIDAERFFEQLKALVAELDEEDRRAAREELTERELAIFDILTRPEPKLTKAEEVAVKAVARNLYGKLADRVAMRDWHLAPQPRADVQSVIRFELNRLPEQPYPETLWDQKVDAVWQHVFTAWRNGDFRAAA